MKVSQCKNVFVKSWPHKVSCLQIGLVNTMQQKAVTLHILVSESKCYAGTCSMSHNLNMFFFFLVHKEMFLQNDKLLSLVEYFWMMLLVSLFILDYFKLCLRKQIPLLLLD